jgi:NHL repeat
MVRPTSGINRSFAILLSMLLPTLAKAQPVITQQPTSLVALAGDNATLTVSVSGTEPFTYQWLFNGTNLPYTPIITTAAGNGNISHSGDGGAAINAGLAFPYGVTVDSVGNLYIADYANNRIRKVGTDGIIATVAGKGNSGYSGDGGPATNASLNTPRGVTVDSVGNLYVADTGSSRIRKVGTDGIITTLVGNGNYGYSGDGGPATSASLRSPYGVTVDDAGNLYIADYANSDIRKVGTDGIITTVAGNGDSGYSGDGGVATNASLSEPSGVAVDSTGTLYIADTGSSRIRKVGTDGIIITLAGNGNADYFGDGGVATNASLYYPTSVAVDKADNIYIADYYNNRIRKVWNNSSPLSSLTLSNVASQNAGNYQVVVTGSGGSVTSSVASLSLVYPPSISQQPTNLVALAGGDTTLTVSASGTGPFTYRWLFNGTNLPIITTVAGNGNNTYAGDGGPATNASLWIPSGVAVDRIGNIYIADNYNNRIRKVATNGIITTVAGNGSYRYSGDGIAATNASLWNPRGVAVDAAGNLYIADTINKRIRKVDTDGIISTVAGNGGARYSGDGGAATSASVNYPQDVAVDSFGNLYIADTLNYRIRKVATDGIITTIAGNGNYGYSGDGGVATDASLRSPINVTVDSIDNVYFSDIYNGRIRMVDTNGIITTVVEGGYGGLAVDKVGNLYIADSLNNRIRKVGADGSINIVAGNGNYGYSGDGGVPTSASLYNPTDVTVDSTGDMYIADYDNNRIRKIWNHGSPFPALVLSKPTSKNTGNYQVIVTGSGGSVTSGVTAVTVVFPPTSLTGISANDHELIWQLAGLSNATYVVQSATNLTPPVNWRPVLTNVADQIGILWITETNLSVGRKFYRAVGQ